MVSRLAVINHPRSALASSSLGEYTKHAIVAGGGASATPSLGNWPALGPMCRSWRVTSRIWQRRRESRLLRPTDESFGSQRMRHGPGTPVHQANQTDKYASSIEGLAYRHCIAGNPRLRFFARGYSQFLLPGAFNGAILARNCWTPSNVR